MKIFSHDYTKAAEAESHLYAAQQLNAHDDSVEAWKHIQDARDTLQQYLNQSNLVEDPEADGFIRKQDFFDEEQLDFIRDLFAEQLEKNPKSELAEDELAIINVCQRNLGGQEYDSIKEFLYDDSGKWRQ